MLIILKIATYVAAENLAISKFVSLKQVIGDMVSEVKRNPNVTWIYIW